MARDYLVGTPEEHLAFQPKTYICARATGKAEIDGRLDKPFWQAAPWSDEFQDIRGSGPYPAPYHRTRMKMLWDDECLYIGARLEEDKIWATLTQRDSVIFQDNDFEVFIDPDGDTHAYYELEINALNTVWDLLLLTPYRDAGGAPCAVNGWDIAGLKSAVSIEGALNDAGAVARNKSWSVELALPWKALHECAAGGKSPRTGDYWRINFSRVEWMTDVGDGKYAKQTDPLTGEPYPEDNWVWSPIGLVNMHYPELWGFLCFAESVNTAFEIPADEKLKWELRKLYYRQKNYFLQYGRYCADYSELCGGDTGGIAPMIETTGSMYEASLHTADGTGIIVIRQDGRCTIKLHKGRS